MAEPKHKLIEVADYLAGDANADVKHEYVAGVVHAMAGGNVRHNRLASNALIALGAQLRGSPCEVFNSDMKIRIRMPDQIRFYYPDVSIVCRSNPPEEAFQDEPVVIIEVVSASTRRIDEGEKKEAYLTIPSLNTYILLEPSERVAVVYCRTEGSFQRTICEGRQALVSLPELNAELKFAQVYENVEG